MNLFRTPYTTPPALAQTFELLLVYKIKFCIYALINPTSQTELANWTPSRLGENGGTNIERKSSYFLLS